VHSALPDNLPAINKKKQNSTSKLLKQPIKMLVAFVKILS